jgi:hypothetical protein
VEAILGIVVVGLFLNALGQKYLARRDANPREGTGKSRSSKG